MFFVMKKINTIIPILCFSINLLIGQTKDTVSMGAGYANMVWYDIEKDVETKIPATSWDIAISMRSFDAAIGVNANNAAITYYQPVNSIAKWTDVVAADTNKLTKPIYNSDITWTVGAFNSTSSDGNVFDYGWGSYAQATRNVNGDSVYIVKTIKGDWKKIAFVALRYDTMYVIKYSNLDGSNEKNLEIKKSTYPKKNFIYLSISDDKILNPEPDNDQWDILFTKYHGLTPDQNGKLQNYTLTGVLQNTVIVNERGVNKIIGASVAEVYRTDTSKDDFDAKKLSPDISTIGSEWKNFNLTTNQWTVSDTTTYFVKNRNAKYYKVNFKGFGGATTGHFIFDRKQVTPTSVKDVYNGTASLAIYPNPSNGQDLTLVYDLGQNVQKVDFQLVSITGQIVYAQKVQNTEGVQQLTLPSLNLPSGLYFALLKWNGQTAVEKVVIR
jgi:Secretion system C-terminal sorting domain